MGKKIRNVFARPRSMMCGSCDMHWVSRIASGDVAVHVWVVFVIVENWEGSSIIWYNKIEYVCPNLQWKYSCEILFPAPEYHRIHATENMTRWTIGCIKFWFVCWFCISSFCWTIMSDNLDNLLIFTGLPCFSQLSKTALEYAPDRTTSQLPSKLPKQLSHGEGTRREGLSCGQT